MYGNVDILRLSVGFFFLLAVVERVSSLFPFYLGCLRSRHSGRRHSGLNHVLIAVRADSQTEREAATFSFHFLKSTRNVLHSKTCSVYLRGDFFFYRGSIVSLR